MVVVVVFGREVEESLTTQVGRLAMVHSNPSAEHGGGHKNKLCSWRRKCAGPLTVLKCHGGHGGPRCSGEGRKGGQQVDKRWT
jgi:hypothetical protein